MTSITSGRVVYSQTLQAAQFEPKKVEIEFCFNVEEGQEAEVVCDAAGKLAVRKAKEMLGIVAKTPAQTPVDIAGTKETAAANLNAAEQTTPKRPPGRPSAADKKKAEEAAAAVKAAANAIDELPDDAPEANKPKPAATDLDDFDAPTGVPEVTDAELTAAASRKNAELAKTHAGAAPAMIRGLRDKYFADPTGKALRDLPQDKRASFMKELEALK